MPGAKRDGVTARVGVDTIAVPEQKVQDVAEAAYSRKEPPSEDTRSTTTRRYVILSFWLVVLLLGLPLWWTTTTVYRAGLPLQEMSNWADGKICLPEYPLSIFLEAPGLQPNEAQDLQRSAQHALDDLNDFSAHHLRLSIPRSSLYDGNGDSSANGVDDDTAVAALTVRLSQEKGITSPSAELQFHTKTLDVTYAPSMLPSSGSSPSLLGSFIANQLQELFAEEQVLLWSLRSPISGGPVKRLSPELSYSLSKRTTRTFKYAPTYHLTFSLFTPGAFPSGWDIERSLEDIFTPLLHAFRPISNFTIDTQVQPYAVLPPSIQPRFDDSRQAWVLQEKDLGGFINTAEWPLSPSIGIGPTINFVLYVASPDQSPLIVDSSSSNSWLVPQWGGVAIFNPPRAQQAGLESLSAEDLKPALLTFSNQLTALLGIPSTPIQSLPVRLSTLTRVRAASVFFSAAGTMGSLARLVSTLPSISIPDSVASNVAATLHHLNCACEHFKQGQFERALDDSKEAEFHAEKAFFEKSMVGQVYFPEEHKVAVYLPLLGPVSVPLLFAALREIRAMLQGRRKRREKMKGN